jgi:FkbM family methyltransferase
VRSFFTNRDLYYRSPTRGKPESGLVHNGRPRSNFDIGANDGSDTDAYLKRGNRVVSVEANPALCVDLRKRFASAIENGQLVVIDKAISRRRKVALYVNSEESGWGTTQPSYAARGHRLRGKITEVEVDTITVIDLIRAYGVPNRVKVDIEGADIICLLDLYGGELPQHLSIERPKSLSDQLFALTLLRRMGYTRFALIDQTSEGKQIHSTSGLFTDDLPSDAWKSFAITLATNLGHYGGRALSAAIRRTPGFRQLAPRGRWFDIHARLTGAHSDPRPVSSG